MDENLYQTHGIRKMSKDSVILGIVLVAIIFLTGLVFVVDAAVPDAPTLDSPKNESELQDLSVYLIVKVNDDDNDWLNITFYNASNNELISWNTVNGSGKAACVWEDLEYGNTYDWYANASDASNTTQSNTFNFSLVAATKSETWSESYIEPEEGLGWTGIENTTQILEMSLKPFLTAMGAWFYAIFIFTTVGLIYVKVQSAFIPSLILLLSGITMSSILPGEVYGASLAMIAMGFSGIIYVVLKRRL